MRTFSVQRVGRRFGDHGAIYREVVLTGTSRGRPVRVVLQLPWDDSPTYAIGDAVDVEWAETQAVSSEAQTDAL